MPEERTPSNPPEPPREELSTGSASPEKTKQNLEESSASADEEGAVLEIEPEVLELVDDFIEDRVGLILEQRAHFFSGPLPDADSAERYEKLQPGAFDRMLTLVEEMQRFQIEQSKTTQREGFRVRKLGQWQAFIIVLAALSIVALGFHVDHPVSAASFGTAVIVAIGGAFYWRQRNLRQGRQEQQEEAGAKEEEGGEEE